jgi:poly-gamma-glutamate capsule biosynthesis protein CapA/YwtB (metallophosphatase superfamily)
MRVGFFTVIMAVSLTGCFDGTVRSPPESNQGRRAQSARDRLPDRRQGKPGQAGWVLKLAAVGDTAMGITPTLPPSPATYFDSIKGELKGDVVFGNLEGTLTEVSESPKCGPSSSECFAFRAPPEYAEHLSAAGFTLMSNANNHSFDFGEAGEVETIEALDRAGIRHTGLPGEITVVKADGRRVAFLGFAPYANAASLTDLSAARALIAEAREEADTVVVAFHAGAEGSDAQHVTGEEEIYLGEDRGNPRRFAHMAIRAGADLILGSGPHVLRGIEVYRARLIAYSLGNFSGYHNFTLEGVLGQTAVLHVTLARDGSFRAGRIASAELIEAGQPAPDPDNAGADLIATLSDEDFGSHAVNVSPGGRLTAPGG